MSEENSSDETYELTQKGLFVHSPTRPIALDTLPLDGNEFISKSKLEETHIFCTQIEDLTFESLEEKEQKRMRQNARRYAEKFSEYAQILTNEREYLKKKFPRKVQVPKGGIKDWCLFCLGSRLYSKIYGERQSEKPIEKHGHLPLLSIIVHLNQDKVIMILKYLYDWFLNLGMEESLGMWISALLACLNMSLDEVSEKFLGRFYNSCELHLKDCEECEMYPLYHISAILKDHFHSDKV